MKAQIRFFFLFFAILTLMSISSANSQDSDIGAKTSNVEMLRQVDMAWSKTAETQQLDKFYSYCLDDARMLAPNAPIIEGKTAITDMFNSLFGMSGFSLKWQPTYVDISNSNDLGYTLGTYEMAFDGPDGKPIVDNGKYMTVWKKGSDGTWKVSADMFNTNVLLPSAEN